MEDGFDGSTDDVWAPTFTDPPIFFTEFAHEGADKGEEEAAEELADEENAEQFFIGTPRRASSPVRHSASPSRHRMRQSMSRRSSRKSSKAVNRSNEEFFQGFESDTVFQPPEVAFPFAESHLLSRSYSEDLGRHLQKRRQKEEWPQQPQRCSSQSALFDLWDDTGSGSVSGHSSDSSSSEAGDSGSAQLRVPLLGSKRRFLNLVPVPASMVSKPRCSDTEVESTTWDDPDLRAAHPAKHRSHTQHQDGTLRDEDTDEGNESFLDRVTDGEACSSLLSPRTYDVLTNYGKAPDGAGILSRLQEEIRRRAHNAWLFTGNEIASDNWLQAERSMVISGHRAAKVRHSGLSRESRIARHMNTRIRELQQKLRKKDEILKAKDVQIQELERAVVAQGAVIAAMSGSRR